MELSAQLPVRSRCFYNRFFIVKRGRRDLAKILAGQDPYPQQSFVNKIGGYAKTADDYVRSIAKNIPFVGDYADEFAASMNTATGLGEGDYEANLAQERQRDLERSDLARILGGATAAGITMPLAWDKLGKAIQGAGILGKGAIIGGTGAIEGGISGFGEGQGGFKERAENAVTSAALGGALAPVAAAAGTGIGIQAKSLARAVADLPPGFNPFNKQSLANIFADEFGGMNLKFDNSLEDKKILSDVLEDYRKKRPNLIQEIWDERQRIAEEKIPGYKRAPIPENPVSLWRDANVQLYKEFLGELENVPENIKIPETFHKAQTGTQYTKMRAVPPQKKYDITRDKFSDDTLVGGEEIRFSDHPNKTQYRYHEPGKGINVAPNAQGLADAINESYKFISDKGIRGFTSPEKQFPEHVGDIVDSRVSTLYSDLSKGILTQNDPYLKQLETAIKVAERDNVKLNKPLLEYKKILSDLKNKIGQ